MGIGPPVAGQGFCLAGANYSTLLKLNLGVPLLLADCAGRPCPLCGGPVDIVGDHAVSCTKSGFGDRKLGNGRRPADILLKAWDGSLGRRCGPDHRER